MSDVNSSGPSGRHLAADGALVPGLGHLGVRALLVATALLQALSWWILDGYQLADSVEYMERARALVNNEEVIDSRSIRSFGFSGLLLPFFAVAELVGVEDFRPVVWLVRLFQIGLGLALVLACVRIGARVAGRGAGLAAGFVVGANPVFLQYSVSPLSDVAAGLCMALAIERLLDPPDARDGRRAGLWLGLGMLMAYKTLPIAGVLGLVVLVRSRRRAIRPLVNLTGVYLVWIAVGIGLDKLVYRSWGASLISYLADNIFGVLIKLFIKLGLRGPAEFLFELNWGEVARRELPNEILLKFQVQPGDWYWTNLPQMLVWPLIGLAVVALARVVARASWASSLLFVTLAVNIAVLSLKSSKEYRLWIPLLPLMAPLIGAGWAWLLGNRGRLGALASAAIVVATVALGVHTLVDRNTRKFSGFWRAIEYVADEAARVRAATPDAPKVRVASSYHWAVYLHEGANVALTKLPTQIDGWRFMAEGEQIAVYSALRDQDWFITHLPILTEPDHLHLTRAIGIWYEVVALYWERHFEDLGPILVMRRKPDDVDLERETLFDVIENADPHAITRSLGLPEPVRLIRDSLDEELWFLGAEYETLPGDGHGWLTSYYYAETEYVADYRLFHRIAGDDERNVWQYAHAPAYGVHRTPSWKPGSVVREGFPVIADNNHDRWNEPARPIGGAYRRGDRIPAKLWLDVATDYLVCVHCREPLVLDRFDPHVCDGVERTIDDGELVVTGRLERTRLDEDVPIREVEPGTRRSREGWQWSPDDYMLVQRLMLPVHPDAALPDDGKPIR